MDALFNMFKVKFDKLDELISKHCTELTRDSRVNLFINLEPIIKKLAGANIEDYLKVRTEEKSYEMISNIINLASHYRYSSQRIKYTLESISISTILLRRYIRIEQLIQSIEKHTNIGIQKIIEQQF